MQAQAYYKENKTKQNHQERKRKIKQQNWGQYNSKFSPIDN